MSRRRLVWLTTWSCVLVAALGAVSILATTRTLALVTTLGLWGFAGVVLRLETTRDFRPVDEPLVDVATVLAAALLGTGAGLAVRTGGTAVGIPVPDLAGAVVAVIAAALAWPAALWLRRSFLSRRYGSGVLPVAEVAAITAGLHPLADPRELLGRAAPMIAAASGHRRARLVMGPDEPVPIHPWTLRPLVVGGERVGTLLLEPTHSEGPEPRQERIVEQLLPTVALMTRAVELAVQAQQARQDVARERDAERGRILGDLHDGLGPVLAGMSMRVAAELRHRPNPVLVALSAELADARDDLRRIVSDLAPSALDGTGLAAALDRLVGSFAGDGASVRLTTRLALEPGAETAVAAYRSVAEGVTNALRHGRAACVDVRVRSTDDARVEVDVRDDGTGGPVVPGIGLTSLRRRAEQLGGELAVSSGSSGVHLYVSLPARGHP